MARYTAAVCRLCRREGQKLFFKGERCNSPKCAISKRSYPPGQVGSGRRRRGRTSIYAAQLRAKQEAKRYYGVLERQFRRFFAMADRSRGITGTVLIQLLERRLDNIVYRMGLAPSRPSARSMVCHGHVLVDGKRLDIPSCIIGVGQRISVAPRMRENKSVLGALDYMKTVGRVEWLEWDGDIGEGRLLTIPDRNQIPAPLKEQLIVELYSK